MKPLWYPLKTSPWVESHSKRKVSCPKSQRNGPSQGLCSEAAWSTVQHANTLNISKGFITDQTPGKLTHCEDNLDHLVWPSRQQVFSKRISVENVLKCQWNPCIRPSHLPQLQPQSQLQGGYFNCQRVVTFKRNVLLLLPWEHYKGT